MRLLNWLGMEPSAQPSLRTRLDCELLEGRALPSTTQTFTFTLSDGNVGSGQFTLPLAQVDPTQSFQQISITDLQVALAGKTFSQAAGDFNGGSLPTTADFSDGVFEGVSFDTGPAAIPPGYQYTDVSSWVGGVTAQGLGGQLFNANMMFGSPQNVTFDFSTLPGGAPTPYTLQVVVNTFDPKQSQTFSIPVTATMTNADVVASLKAALAQSGYYVDVNGLKITIGGTTGANASGLQSVSFSILTPQNGQLAVDNTIPTMKLSAVVNAGNNPNQQTVGVQINGKDQVLTPMLPPPRPQPN